VKCISEHSVLLYLSTVVFQYTDHLVNYAVEITYCICLVLKLATEFHVFTQNNTSLYPV